MVKCIQLMKISTLQTNVNKFLLLLFSELFQLLLLEFIYKYSVTLYNIHKVINFKYEYVLL